MISTAPKSSGNSRGMLVTILAVAGVVGYVMAGFLPAQKLLLAKRRELRDKKQFIANAELKSAAVAPLQAQLAVARQHVDSWRKNSRAESGTVVLLGELATLAAKSGVVLHRMTPQDPATMETLRQQTIEIELEGSFSQVIQFLRGVELRCESIWLPQFEIKPAKEGGKNVQCALSVVVFADNRGNSG